MLIDMPLLQATKEYFSNIDLSDTLLISCQHVLLTNVVMYEQLLGLGLKAENCYVLGKAYSTHRKAFKIMKELGIQVSELSKNFESGETFDVQYQRYINTFLQHILPLVEKREFSKLLIVDDGGVLLQSVITQIIEGRLSHISIVGVEQTSSGYTKLKDCSLPFPIINVARSTIKLDHESILIARLAHQKIRIILEKFAYDPQQVVILGGGPIGASMKKAFLEHNSKTLVKIYDIEHDKSDIIDVEMEREIYSADMIVGCTGTQVISQEQMRKMKPGVILVSNSSSDREFEAVYLRTGVKEYYNPQKNITVDDITLFYSGFPIAFYDQEGLQPADAQLTRSIMFAAICQAHNVGSTQLGFIDLDEKAQEFILGRYKSLT